MKKIAVVAANFRHVFPAEILRVIEKESEGKFGIMQQSTSALPDYEKDQLKKILYERSPSALIAVCMNPEKSVLDEYTEKGVPVVLIDEYVEGHSMAACDNYTGGYTAAKFLCGAGKRRIAVITGKMDVEGGYNARKRYEGFKAALYREGERFDEKYLVEVVSYSYKEGDESLKKMVKEGLKPDAVFCAAGDICAMGVMKAARELSVKVPNELSIIGYDDMEKSKSTRPPLTTIRQPYREMAAYALDMVTRRAGEILKKPEKKLFEPRLIKRETVSGNAG